MDKERRSSPVPGAALVEALQNPALFDHPVERFEIVETHISWVLLTGPYAYKIKKSVDLGFLDFSTLERRHFFCDEEVRLNCRLAPELYLGVVPITGSVRAPVLGGTGVPVEYAVKMVQFDRTAQLDAVLARGALAPHHIDQLATDVADFHARAAVAPADGPWGTMDALRRPALDNLDALDSDPADPALRDTVAHLREWTLRSLAEHEPDFDLRRREGRVRECHGDMHLSNMALRGDRVVLFDCLEFSESLRWTDVMAEVAFLVMDLDYRGRQDYARRFTGRYLERGGDYAGLRVLRHYLVYRSLVRAKVAAIRLREPALEPGAREAAERKLRGHVELALGYTRGFAATPLIITRGLSGSGKSWLAARLVEATGAVRIRSDVERKRLHGLDEGLRSGDVVGGGLYAAGATRRTYARLLDLARGILAAGFPVIVDATFLQRAQRESFRALSKELGVPYRILDVDAPPEVLRERIAGRISRAEGVSDATLEVLERQRRGAEPLAAGERASTVAVDTAREVDVGRLAAALLHAGS